MTRREVVAGTAPSGTTTAGTAGTAGTEGPPDSPADPGHGVTASTGFGAVADPAPPAGAGSEGSTSWDDSLDTDISTRRPVDPSREPDDTVDETRLRPKHLSDFVGQKQLVEHLEIVLEAARRRGQAVDHILFAGPPGLGKTSLAAIVAAEMGVGLRVTSGPALVRGGDLASLLTDLNDGDALFIDEIHRLPRPVEEVLYPAMEDFQLDILIGKGPTARSIRLDLPHFTLIGATTRTGLLTGPLRDRFGFVGRVDLYDSDELEQIVVRSAGILGIPIDALGARQIACRSRGTPRIANRLLRRVRDFVEVRADGKVDEPQAAAGLELFGVDRLGLDKVDRAILDVLCCRFAGQPVGLTTLAQCVGEQTDTVEDAYEPYLLQQGLLLRTSRGRMAGERAYRHLGLATPAHLTATPGSAAITGSPGTTPHIAPPELFDIA